MKSDYDKYKNIIYDNLNDHKSILEEIILSNKFISNIEYISKKMVKCLRGNGKILICGNGGSFSDALHFNSELLGRYKKNRKSIPSIVLGSNPSALTAISNDYGYEKSFDRELKALANKKDLLISITTSGRSKNILNVIRSSIAMKIDTILFTGDVNFKIKSKYLNIIKIPSKETGRIQEFHYIIFHIISEIIEENLF